MKLIPKIIFRISIGFIALAFILLILSQSLPFEFADHQFRAWFYTVILFGLPIATALTLFGTIKSRQPAIKTISIIFFTLLGSAFMFNSLIHFLLLRVNGEWLTATTLYRHKTENKKIKEQYYVPALGSSNEKRIVEVKPFLKIWVLPSPVSSPIDTSKWIYVNEPGEIKFP